MHFKRRNKMETKSTDRDVESQSSPLGDQSESASPRTRPASSSSAPGGGAGGSVAVLLRKLMMITARDVQESTQGNYLLTIIKDVISGTILGVFFLMILIFLDYRNIVQLGSARAFRRAAFELMTDPETVKTIEENIDIKFIPTDVYTSMSEEIERNQAKVKDDSGLKQHEADLALRTKELEEVRKEYEVIKAHGDKLLGIDRWCGGCKGGWGNCNARVRYLMDTYHTAEITAKVDIMTSGKCINK
ncbi:hypothetical protein ACHAWF_010287 [Thalassiosira exigua]